MKIILVTCLALLFLLPLSPLWSQSNNTIIQKRNLPLSANSLLLKNVPSLPKRLSASFTAFRFQTNSSFLPNLQQSMDVFQQSNVASVYCVADLAFFCRLEVQMEKATKIPVRFRLGDVQQVDYLEGKYEGWRYGH
jgi:hypothetical protein